MNELVVRLRGLQGPYEGRIWEAADRLQVGRLNKCPVYLDDGSVSRAHAEVVETGRGWAVRDLGSTNGTFLNGERVGPVELLIREGDILQFGEVCVAVDAARTRDRAAADSASGWHVTRVSSASLEESLRLYGRSTGEMPQPSEAFLPFMQAGRASHSADSLKAYLEGLLWELAEPFAATAAALLLVEEHTGTLELQAALDLAKTGGLAPWTEPWAGQQALAEGCSLLLHRGPDKQQGDPSAQSVLCALLRSPGRNLGILYLVRGHGQPAFEEGDLLRANALAWSIAPSIEAFQSQFRRQEEQFIKTLGTLNELVNLRAGVSEGHPQRVTDYALLLADELNLSPADRHCLRLGAPLHDLGALGVSDAILHKPAPLTPAEVREVRRQFLKAAALCESLPSLVPLIPIVRNHRERWDGSGYPDGLAGEQIPLLGRIVGLADAFDAMTTDRPYRRALGLEEALAEVRRQSARQFDPACVAALVRLQPHLAELFAARQLATHTVSRATLESVRASLGMGKFRSTQEEAPAKQGSY